MRHEHSVAREHCNEASGTINGGDISVIRQFLRKAPATHDHMRQVGASVFWVVTSRSRTWKGSRVIAIKRNTQK